jgi:hypothetical protein
MSKKRARIAARAGGGTANAAPPATTTPPRSRKAIARANRRARPRDDYYEAEDAEAGDVHDTKRFDVSVRLGREGLRFPTFARFCAPPLRHLRLPLMRASPPLPPFPPLP